MKTTTRFRDSVEVHIGEHSDDGRKMYRAELWVRPYSGYILAKTRWVKTPKQATHDGKRCFNPSAIRQWTSQ